MDFMADLSTLEVIDPDTKEYKEGSQQEEGLTPDNSTPLLNLLNADRIPYAHCSCFSTGSAQLRQDMDLDEAREIVGAYCVTREDKVREWFVKVPDLKAVKDSSLVSFPGLISVPEGEQELQEYMQEPIEPVRCLPDLADSVYWR